MRVKSLPQAHLDGAADMQSAALVARHLEACRRCGLAADAYRQLCEALRASTRDLTRPLSGASSPSLRNSPAATAEPMPKMVSRSELV